MAYVGRTDASSEAVCKLLRGESHLGGKVVAEPKEQEISQTL